MTPDEILKQTTINGMTIAVGTTGKLKVAGTQEAINQFGSILRTHKQAIIDYLWRLESCKACPQFEEIEINRKQVPGCVHLLSGGAWKEEWRRLPSALERCKTQ